MLSPRPPAPVAPSIWYDDVAAPHRKLLGNCRPASAVEALSRCVLTTVTGQVPQIPRWSTSSLETPSARKVTGRDQGLLWRSLTGTGFRLTVRPHHRPVWPKRQLRLTLSCATDSIERCRACCLLLSLCPLDLARP